MRPAWVFVLVAAAIAAAVWLSVPKHVPLAASGADPAYLSRIQPIFERRCVVYHACFDSPCQLNLQSFEGLDRGASRSVVYRPNRLEAMAPTRMFQDARSTAEWRARFDFFPVVSRGSDPLDGRGFPAALPGRIRIAPAIGDAISGDCQREQIEGLTNA